MSTTAIRAEGLGKRYRIGVREPYRDFRDVVAHTFTASFRAVASAVRGRNKAAAEQGAGCFWALQELSFEIQRGDVVGIIGRNGAGKSTLLKILTRITRPTAGYAEVHGRVGSLLEMGTGFHPDLTGRENIFLNGAILGMRRAEIARKFDAIVAFAAVERFLDTPVKHYSSGMYMRLAFSVAAHLDPEILIVDEVLAVGDAAFQRKCLGKMDDVAREGRTILFVSHSIDMIQRLCSRCILLEQGRLVAHDTTARVVTQYLSTNALRSDSATWIDLAQVSRTGSGEARFVALKYSSLNEATAFKPYSDGPLEITIIIESKVCKCVDSLAVIVYSQAGTRLMNLDTSYSSQSITLKEGRNVVVVRIAQLHLKPREYILGLRLARSMGSAAEFDVLDCAEYICNLEVGDYVPEGPIVRPDYLGVVTAKYQVTHEQ